MFAILTVLVTTLHYVNCARILGVASMPSYSHQVVFRPLWAELSLRGHQVTVLTTDPVRNSSLTNLTEIDWHDAYDIWRKHDIVNKMAQNQHALTSLLDLFEKFLREISDYQFNHPDVQRLLNHKNVTFDLAIIELAMFPPLAYSSVFKCPYIGIMSLDTYHFFHATMGNPTNPVAYPNPFAPVGGKLNFWERLISVVSSVSYQYIASLSMQWSEAIIKQHIKEPVASMEEIVENMTMMFLNLNPVLHPPRPLSPSTIAYGGGIHIEPARALPEKLQSLLDNATNGVVYFSMGSNAKSKDFPIDVKKILLDTFSALPFTVLWKYEDDELPGRPDNVKIEKWLPQQQILRHPNIRLFITQGGAQSMEEAIYAGVPMLVMPFFADQQYNAKNVVLRGFGLSADYKRLDKNELKNTILEVVNNPKYKISIQEGARKSLDQPMSGLEQAVWWTEYVLRHNSTKHFRATGRKLSVVEYYFLDVISFIVAVTVTFLYVMFRLAQLILKVLFKENYSKQKNK